MSLYIYELNFLSHFSFNADKMYSLKRVRNHHPSIVITDTPLIALWNRKAIIFSGKKILHILLVRETDKISTIV